MRRYFIFPALFLVFSLNSVAYAEFTCRVEISYKWKRAEADSKEEEVRISGVEGKGADENAAKQAVGELTGREKSRAHERCRAQHENGAQCVASKYEASAAALQNVGFAARKAIEDAIASDCKAVQGTCTGVVGSEPACSEKVEAGTGAEAGKDGKEGKEAGGKESKKK